MARIITIGNTILDYIDALIELHMLDNKEISAFSLNLFEWGQLLHLIEINHNDCKVVIQYDKEDKYLRYKNILLFYDLSMNQDSDYMYHLDAVRAAVRERLSGQQTQQNTIQHIPTPVARGYQHNSFDQWNSAPITSTGGRSTLAPPAQNIPF